MKRFLEELANNKTHLIDAMPTKTEAQRKRIELRTAYKKLVGRRALHVSKGEKDSRVVVIKEAHERYVRVSYKYYGMDYTGEVNTSITYLSLICGDDRLDVE